MASRCGCGLEFTRETLNGSVVFGYVVSSSAFLWHTAAIYCPSMARAGKNVRCQLMVLERDFALQRNDYEIVQFSSPLEMLPKDFCSYDQVGLLHIKEGVSVKKLESFQTRNETTSAGFDVVSRSTVRPLVAIVPEVWPPKKATKPDPLCRQCGKTFKGSGFACSNCGAVDGFAVLAALIFASVLAVPGFVWGGYAWAATSLAAVLAVGLTVSTIRGVFAARRRQGSSV